MRASKQMSMAAIMWLVLVAALESAFFLEFRFVRFMLLIPPITMAILSLNLGFLFLVIRPRRLEPRIVGMLLGGVAAVFGTVLGLDPLQSRLLERSPSYAILFAPVLGLNRMSAPIIENVRNSLLNWTFGLSDQQGVTATVVRFISVEIWVIVAVLFDMLGTVMIWAGGSLENRWRRQARSQSQAPSQAPPLDERAASPL
jgi:hypothetical protein